MIKEDVIVKIFEKADRWRFEIECGKYRLAGYGDGFDNTELLAYKTLKAIPNHGTIHVYYPEGKEAPSRNENI